MVGAWQLATTNMAQRSWDLPLLWATLPLVGALVLAAAIIAAVKKWQQHAGPERLTATDQMAHFRSLYERGDLSAEEYARVRALLGEQMKQELDLPPAANASASPATEPREATEENVLPSPPREQLP